MDIKLVKQTIGMDRTREKWILRVYHTDTQEIWVVYWTKKKCYSSKAVANF